MSETGPGARDSDAGRDGRDDAAAAVLAAFDGLRRDIRSRFPRERAGPPEVPDPTGPSGAQRENTIDLEALWRGVRRRLGTVGMRERDDRVDEFGMDADALAGVARLFDFLADRYWRIEVTGLDYLPRAGGFLLVANRAGLLPWDGLMLAHILHRARPDQERPRFLVDDGLIQRPFAHATLAQLGGVRACRDNLLRLLAAGRPVISFPEGERGATKAYRDRYEVQPFEAASDLRVAHECGLPIFPVGIVGAEEVQPLVWKFEAPARRVGLPFLPVTPTFPMLGPIGLAPLPSKWVIRIGRPLDQGQIPEAEASETDLARENERARSAIERLLHMALRDRESVWR